MEYWYKKGVIRQLGISNCYNFNFFNDLYNSANVKPAVLQNRFYKESNYDEKLRRFCLEHNVTYQSFWTLTANPHLLKNQAFSEISESLEMTTAQLFFTYLIHLGIQPLTGTSKESHMVDDLVASSKTLSPEIAGQIDRLMPFS